jgi:predicted MFS family arabinose efflux permease
MFSRRLKTGYFLLEGMNSFATVYYFYYFYFYMQKAFEFGNKANLTLAALNGATYAVFAWWGGRFAQRYGYFNALKLGFGLMIASLALGARLTTASGQIATMLGTVIGMCFTWPTLEALVSEGESPAGVQHMVGVYNVIWAATAAIAYFTGGAMLDHWGLRSLFVVPMTIQIVQLGLTFWLEAKARQSGELLLSPSSDRLPATGTVPAAPAKTKRFLRMAWLANPFAYIAIQTLIAAMPGIARRLELSTMLAGFYGSVWCFARLGAFAGLWLWSGWHYRFRWLLMAYLALVGTFAAILLAPNIAVLVAAQLIFGLAVGLLYYSSLFYSMDLGDTKGEHGGIHEAVIGLGNCAGPAVGAAALHFLPQYSNSGTLAVSVLLLSGLGGLMAIWSRPERAAQTSSLKLQASGKPQASTSKNLGN